MRAHTPSAHHALTRATALDREPGTQSRSARIHNQRKASDTFDQKPVLIIDIPRSKSTHTKTLYTTLETIQGVYGEWTTPPHILVFANTSPDVDKLSPDRMHVYLITSEYVLQPAKHLEKGLEKYDAHLAELQAQEEEAARTGVTPARLLRERGAAGSSGVTSSAPPDDVHQARGPAATRTSTALCPPNLAASHLRGIALGNTSHARLPLVRRRSSARRSGGSGQTAARSPQSIATRAPESSRSSPTVRRRCGSSGRTRTTARRR